MITGYVTSLVIKPTLFYVTIELRVHALGSDWNLITQDDLIRVLSGSLATVSLSEKTGCKDEQLQDKTST